MTGKGKGASRAFKVETKKPKGKAKKPAAAVTRKSGGKGHPPPPPKTAA